MLSTNNSLTPGEINVSFRLLSQQNGASGRSIPRYIEDWMIFDKKLTTLDDSIYNII